MTLLLSEAATAKNILKERNELQTNINNLKIEVTTMKEKNDTLRSTITRMRKSGRSSTNNTNSADAAAAEAAKKTIQEALKKTEKELRVTVSKLIAAEEASETAFTCMTCLEIMKKPGQCCLSLFLYFFFLFLKMILLFCSFYYTLKSYILVPGIYIILFHMHITFFSF